MDINKSVLEEKQVFRYQLPCSGKSSDNVLNIDHDPWISDVTLTVSTTNDVRFRYTDISFFKGYKGLGYWSLPDSVQYEGGFEIVPLLIEHVLGGLENLSKRLLEHGSEPVSRAGFLGIFTRTRKGTDKNGTGYCLFKPNKQIAGWIVSPLLACENGVYELVSNQSVGAMSESHNIPWYPHGIVHLLIHHVGSVVIWRNLFGSEGNRTIMEIHFSKAVVTFISGCSHSNQELLVLVGFSSGEVLLWNFFAATYWRFNPDSSLVDSKVCCCLWMPGSNTKFLVGFQNGSILLFDRFELEPVELRTRHENILRSVAEPDGTNPSQRSGPKCLSTMSISSDGNRVVVGGKDGTITVINLSTSVQEMVVRNRLGGINCAVWSPDGKYIFTGGEDDEISIWRLEHAELVARCKGHDSWVSGIAIYKSDHQQDRTMYKFASVGQDTNICLWALEIGIRSGQTTIVQPCWKQCLDEEPLTFIQSIDSALVVRTLSGNIKVYQLYNDRLFS